MLMEHSFSCVAGNSLRDQFFKQATKLTKSVNNTGNSRTHSGLSYAKHVPMWPKIGKLIL